MKHFKTWIIATLVALTASVAFAQNEYRVRAGDTLVIEVLEDSGLNRSLEVLPDGRVNFPFAGNVAVSGRTVGQIEASIKQAIAPNFTAEPNVFVSVQPGERQTRTPAAPPTMEIFFLGEVNTPGMVEVEPGTRFLQAMARSGGLTRFAADKRIQLRRTISSSGQTQLFEINYRAILDGAEVSNNVRLHDGDVIIVPERRLFE
ncbi:polysaccharide export outer membrane protein [Cognatiyoonia koreensis]|uniref:Polysaccharide export outer membrane protein n=1 Tax=Cognatiyoonia koreensis TaxID=364200 RepID=A0A1I0RSF4_9RHOB|nr:polysaccharide biosynthesis/export family protein [Cognatiyoonia koreensis]SEW44214.1 polysaccharide export outer membrane protein [Cognatiyoonia koreensis]